MLTPLSLVGVSTDAVSAVAVVSAATCVSCSVGLEPLLPLDDDDDDDRLVVPSLERRQRLVEIRRLLDSMRLFPEVRCALVEESRLVLVLAMLLREEEDCLAGFWMPELGRRDEEEGIPTFFWLLDVLSMFMLRLRRGDVFFPVAVGVEKGASTVTAAVVASTRDALLRRSILPLASAGPVRTRRVEGGVLFGSLLETRSLDLRSRDDERFFFVSCVPCDMGRSNGGASCGLVADMEGRRCRCLVEVLLDVR